MWKWLRRLFQRSYTPQEALAQGVVDWTSELIRKVAAINHKIGWGRFDIGQQNGPRSGGFVYVTWDTETALKAHRVLEDAGLLCSTDLGPSHVGTYKVKQ